ncbi:MAG: DegT/DnrJ/EryC1/StrS aminotransferase family protein [Roseburia sp.]|nr:DegT/DnrJ/EryC1/StrS aminotransferase family protein [Roseburia sp.]
MERKNITFSPPDITEEEISAVGDTLRSGWITTGPKTKKFESRIAEYCGTQKAVCFNSATASLEMTLRFLGIGSGDEVITSAYTYTASASPACHVGADLVLIDTDENSFEMDYAQLEDAITERTKVIVPVDIGGVMCDYERIFEIVERKRHLFHSCNEIQKAFGRVIVIADSAHGFGAIRNGVRSGNAADFTCFSFHAVKNLTTAEGGALTWKSRKELDDENIYHEFMLLSLHGQSKDALHKSQLGAWEYDIISPAFKCNMTDIMAAIGLVQLDRYPSLLARRREIIQKYDAAFRELKCMGLDHYNGTGSSSGHLYLLRIPNADEEKRNEIIRRMAEYGVTTNVHYKPLPMMTAYKKLGFNISDYPNAYHQYENEISLPLHTGLSDDDVDYIIEMLKKVLGEC